MKPATFVKTTSSSGEDAKLTLSKWWTSASPAINTITLFNNVLISVIITAVCTSCKICHVSVRCTSAVYLLDTTRDQEHFLDTAATSLSSVENCKFLISQTIIIINK